MTWADFAMLCIAFVAANIVAQVIIYLIRGPFK
jgi:hypothetical protein